MFAAFPANHVLLYDTVYLVYYDVIKRKRLGTLHVGSKGKLKATVWNDDESLVALIFTKVQNVT